MRLWTRVWNVFRGDAVNGEIAEELEAHVSEAVAAGRDEREVRRSMGSVMRVREESHQVRVVGWMDSLRADAVFGWRQLWKRKVTTLAAVLSLGLGIGSCVAAFRLVDALFLRPLPVSHPERLYEVFRQGPGFRDGTMMDPQWSFEYPVFEQMRDAVKDQAMVVGVMARQIEVTFGGGAELEQVQAAYVTGGTFGTLGQRPELGRLLTESDDTAPGGAPYAVLSYDYWQRRFGGDTNVIGRVMRLGDRDGGNEVVRSSYRVVGVAAKGFTGTQPGTMTDLFLPASMYDGVTKADWSWIGPLVALRPGADPEPVGERMEAVYQARQREAAKGFSGRGKQFVERFLAWHTVLRPAGAGFSRMQADYRLPLMVLCVLVGMVLLIACANVANLMSAQSAARAREMALRVSLGAGRSRLVRLVLVESAMVGAAAAGLGLMFAWWAAPFVVTRISTEKMPVRLELHPDWMVAGFGLLLALAVTMLSGALPALRASRVRPASALKGSEEPVLRGRTMYVLVAAQVGFCFVVLFVAGLFTATFARLMTRPLGFAAAGLVVIDTAATQALPAAAWEQAAERLRSAPGVEQVGLSMDPLLSGDMFGTFIKVNGETTPKMVMLMEVEPGWLGTMRVPLLDGRDLSVGDSEAGASRVALVSRRFALDNFGTKDAVGRTFAADDGKPVTVVGVVGDVRYQNMREEDAPLFYEPYLRPKDKVRNGAFSVRVSGAEPMAMADTLRRMVLKAQPEFQITSVRTEQGMIAAQTVKERLLAGLGGFFAGVALLLAAVGLYGVLHYSVVQREREIGIRIALGAAAGNIARIVTARVMAMVLLGAAAGMVCGVASVRFVSTLLYGVKGTDVSMMVLPGVVLLGAAGLAALPAVWRAVRIDPVVMLRSE